MTRDQITLLQQSFFKVMMVGDKANPLFYKRLFEIDPSARPLFKEDVSEQGQKLIKMIGMALQHLSSPAEVLPLLAELGPKHVVEYGVVDAQYETVRSALIWTLKQELGNEFTPQVEAAWGEAYELIAKIMKDAGRQNRT